MRDLIVTENVSLDGVLDGDFYLRAGEASDYADVDNALRAQREAADALVLGRKTFEAFRSYWPQQTDNASGTRQYLNRVAKYVVSKTRGENELGWENTTVLRSVEDVAKLKTDSGEDIVVTGSVSLVHALIAASLVDEFRLFTYPVLVGAGRRLFIDASDVLALVECQPFDSGVVLTRYRRDATTTRVRR